MQQKKSLYEIIIKKHVSAIIPKQWPFNYDCGNWDKHHPDENGRRYIIRLNKTRGVECGKTTLIHELVHINNDLEGIEISEGETEDKALTFCKKNKKFVDYLWEKYVCN